jgi:hypothetical protein
MVGHLVHQTRCFFTILLLRISPTLLKAFLVSATVFYGRDGTPYTISHTRNETEGDFRVKWHSTDPWRGYYETKSDK